MRRRITFLLTYRSSNIPHTLYRVLQKATRQLHKPKNFNQSVLASRANHSKSTTSSTCDLFLERRPGEALFAQGGWTHNTGIDELLGEKLAHQRQRSSVIQNSGSRIFTGSRGTDSRAFRFPTATRPRQRAYRGGVHLHWPAGRWRLLAGDRWLRSGGDTRGVGGGRGEISWLAGRLSSLAQLRAPLPAGLAGSRYSLRLLDLFSNFSVEFWFGVTVLGVGEGVCSLAYIRGMTASNNEWRWWPDGGWG